MTISNGQKFLTKLFFFTVKLNYIFYGILFAIVNLSFIIIVQPALKNVNIMLYTLVLIVIIGTL